MSNSGLYTTRLQVYHLVTSALSENPRSIASRLEDPPFRTTSVAFKVLGGVTPRLAVGRDPENRGVQAHAGLEALYTVHFLAEVVMLTAPSLYLFTRPATAQQRQHHP